MKAAIRSILHVPVMTVILAAVLISSRPCRADRGDWHIYTEPVTLTESGQNQILCLATDVSASRSRIYNQGDVPEAKGGNLILARGGLELMWATTRLGRK